MVKADPAAPVASVNTWPPLLLISVTGTAPTAKE